MKYCLALLVIVLGVSGFMGGTLALGEQKKPPCYYQGLPRQPPLTPNCTWDGGQTSTCKKTDKT